MPDTSRYFAGMAIAAAVYFLGLAGFTLHRGEMPRGRGFLLHRRRPPIRGQPARWVALAFALAGILFLVLTLVA